MKDDPKIEMENADTYTPKRKRIGYGNNQSFRILLIIILILIFIGGTLYFLKGVTRSESNLLQLKISALEEKTAMLEKRFEEVQGKVSPPGPDSNLLQRVDALAKRIEDLEKQKKPSSELKAKAPPPVKTEASNKNQYHTVQKGETLLSISKKYGIRVEELLKQNHLSRDQPLRIGQKLLISTGH